MFSRLWTFTTSCTTTRSGIFCRTLSSLPARRRRAMCLPRRLFAWFAAWPSWWTTTQSARARLRWFSLRISTFPRLRLSIRRPTSASRFPRPARKPAALVIWSLCLTARWLWALWTVRILRFWSRGDGTTFAFLAWPPNRWWITIWTAVIWPLPSARTTCVCSGLPSSWPTAILPAWAATSGVFTTRCCATMTNILCWRILTPTWRPGTAFPICIGTRRPGARFPCGTAPKRATSAATAQSMNMWEIFGGCRRRSNLSRFNLSSFYK